MDEGPVRITEDDVLYRRCLFKAHINVLNGQRMVRWQAFKPRVDESYISVSLARLNTPERVLALGVDGQGLVHLPASVPLGLGLDIQHIPTNEDRVRSGILGVERDSPPGIETMVRLASASSVLLEPINGAD